MKKISYLIFTIFLLSIILSNVALAQTTQTAPQSSPWSDFLSHPIDFMTAQLRGAAPSNPDNPFFNKGGSPPSTLSNSSLTYGASPSSGGIGGLLNIFGSILQMILPMTISIAVVWFVYNVFRYTVLESEEDKTKAKTQIFWGIIGIFVMASVWGLVNILRFTFNVSNGNISVPGIQATFDSQPK